jgi:hypothetical protein
LIEPDNLITELTNILTGLSLIESKLMNLSPGSPDLQSEVENIEAETAETIMNLPEIIKLTAESQPDPEIMGDKLKDSIDKVTNILASLTELRKNF